MLYYVTAFYVAHVFTTAEAPMTNRKKAIMSFKCSGFAWRARRVPSGAPRATAIAIDAARPASRVEDELNDATTATHDEIGMAVARPNATPSTGGVLGQN